MIVNFINLYKFNSIALKEDSPEDAIKEFQNVIESDTEQSEW